MTAVALTIALVILAVLAVLQVLVASGLPLGRLVWGGQHRVLPKSLRIGSAISVVLYAGMAVLLLSRGGAAPGDGAFVRVAVWVLFAYFVIGALMNAISRSRPERLVMTPVSIVLAAATLLIALDG